MKDNIILNLNFKSIIIFLLCFCQIQAYATDVTVRVSDLRNVDNVIEDGSIQIDFDSNILPVLLDWQGPCEDPPPIELNGPFQISGIVVDCIGEYNFNLITGFGTPNECCLSFTVEVKYCPISSLNSLLCVKYTTGGNPKADGFGSGSSYFNPDGSLMSEYTLHTSWPQSQLELVSNSISNQIDFAAAEILTIGTTNKMIASQSEFVSDDDFIFKFDQYGDLIWVYYKDASKTANSREEEKIGKDNSKPFPRISDIENKDQKNYADLEIKSIYPNPFHSDLNIEINSPIEADLNIRLISLQGQICVDKRINASKGFNLVEISPKDKLPNGMYLIQIVDSLGKVYTKQVMHVSF